MEHLELRETSVGNFLLSCTIYGIWIAFSTYVIYFFFAFPEHCPTPWFAHIIALTYSLFLIPCILGLTKCFISYNTVLEISNDEVILKRGKRIHCVPMSRITEYGCAGFIYRDSYLFFCTSSKDEISNYARKNAHLAKRYFGKKRAKNMSATQYGQWQLMVGIYVKSALKSSHRDAVLIFGDGWPRTLKKVSHYMKTEPILTGPVLIDDPNPWKTK